MRPESADERAAGAGALAVHPDDKRAAALLCGVLLRWRQMTPEARLNLWLAVVANAPAQSTPAPPVRRAMPDGWRVVPNTRGAL
jgi:hypothetical protein